MEVADRIAVMDRGRIEQVGPARELYEHPVNQFVMTFMGSVNRLGEAFVRPHDIELSAQRNGVTSPATIERLVYLGWEVRVDLRRLDDGERMSAQVTRDEAEESAEEARTAAEAFFEPRAGETRGEPEDAEKTEEAGEKA